MGKPPRDKLRFQSARPSVDRAGALEADKADGGSSRSSSTGDETMLDIGHLPVVADAPGAWDLMDESGPAFGINLDAFDGLYADMPGMCLPSFAAPDFGGVDRCGPA